TGTAAVISPVGQLKYGDTEIVINNNETGEVTQNLYDNYVGIQSGKLDDPNGWRVVVPRYYVLSKIDNNSYYNQCSTSETYLYKNFSVLLLLFCMKTIIIQTSMF